MSDDDLDEDKLDDEELDPEAEEQWVRRVSALPCPACAATSTRPIIWDMPTSDDYERYADRVDFGGCIVPEEPWPQAHCDACQHDFVVPAP